MPSEVTWPELDYAGWRDTAATLHLWTQVVGKVRLALTPWVNHSWQVPLYVTARGLNTSPMPVDGQVLDIEFDFISHDLVVRTSEGESRRIGLVPQTVADFYARVMETLADLGVKIALSPLPSEVPEPIPFPEDNLHAAYDPAAAQDFWRVLLQADRVLKLFRTGFLGKVSPVHFFWGGFDLAVTRFSGRRAPPHPGGMPGLPDAIVREAYSHEVSSAGFWPGNDAFPRSAFYSYAYPEPRGFRDLPMPGAAYFDEVLGEYILPYDAVRMAAKPDELLMSFLTATYGAAADTGGWDRALLECDIGVPARVRHV